MRLEPAAAVPKDQVAMLEEEASIRNTQLALADAVPRNAARASQAGPQAKQTAKAKGKKKVKVCRPTVRCHCIMRFTGTKTPASSSEPKCGQHGSHKLRCLRAGSQLKLLQASA